MSNATITADTKLYTITASFAGYTLADRFVGCETLDEVILLCHANPESVFLDRDECVMSGDNNEADWGTGFCNWKSVTEFTPRTALREVAMNG